MNERQLKEIVAKLKSAGTDTQDVEVKESVGKLPASVVETLSAFSNGSGGTLILGLSERNDFQPASGFDARRIADSLAQACAEKMTPPVRASIDIVAYGSSNVVVAVVDEISPKDKPCYVTERGAYKGSYIRTFDGDRKLVAYEIDRLLEDRTQPTHDIEPVEGAALGDLDKRLVGAVLSRQRDLHPRVFGQESDEEMLMDLHIAARAGGGLVPTLAGLLALGTYPQKFFPRLTVTFAAYPGVEKASDPEVKFLDSEKMAGPIPAIISDTVAAVRRNTRLGGVMDGIKRMDAPDYPPAAVREAVCNALMHRDYSSLSRGTQVQVNLYDDRLEILSPGGLYGTVTTETIGRAGYSSTRNQYLSDILESTPYEGGFVAENRGTGFRLMARALERNGMQPPVVKDSVSMFSLTFVRRAGVGVAVGQATGADRAGTDNGFADAGQTAAVDGVGDSVLAPAAGSETDTSCADAVSAYIGEHEPCSASEIAQALAIPRSTLTYRLRKLVEQGAVERIGETRSRNQRYRLA